MSSKKTSDAIAIILADSNPIWFTSVDTGTFGQAILSTGFTYYFDDGAIGPATTKYTSLPSVDYSPAFSLYRLMKSRVEQFPILAPSVKHTALVSNLYTVQASFSNVGRIISSGSMISIEGMPTSLLFNIPENPGQGASGAPIQFIETPGDLQYGWRKAFPGVTRLALFKWRISQTWQFGIWPVKMYGAVL